MLLAVVSAGYTFSNNNERTQLHEKNIGNCIKIAKSEKKLGTPLVIIIKGMTFIVKI